jgi:hypothetical protein
MYPPVDPWDAPIDPTSPLPTVPTPPSVSTPPTPPTPMYGRAAVPVPPRRFDNTEEMPVVVVPGPRAAPEGMRRSAVPTRQISFERPSSAARRSLSDGWGLSGLGLLVAFCGWGVWAIAARGTGAVPLVGLVMTLIVGAGVFTVSRFAGYVILEQVLHRTRQHARWSHAIAGLFLAASGISYLGNATWLSDAVTYLEQQILRH